MPPANCPATTLLHPWKNSLCMWASPIRNHCHSTPHQQSLYLVPYNLLFVKKDIHWYCDLLLNHENVDNMTGIDNVIMMVFGLCPPYKLQDYYQIDPDQTFMHFMRETPDEVWVNDTHKVIQRGVRFQRNSQPSCKIAHKFYSPSPRWSSNLTTILGMPLATKCLLQPYRTRHWCHYVLLFNLPSGDLTDMARSLALLTHLLIGTDDAYTPHIINSVCGEDANTQLALGGSQSDLSLVHQKLLTLS